MRHPEINKSLLSELKTLRASLHVCAERAGSERRTASVVSNFLEAYPPDQLVRELGGTGIAAAYQGNEPGPTVLVRGELDALPIEEKPGSVSIGDSPANSHRCGHDGHMAIVAGLAPLLSARRPARGRIVLLFQPAEETGEGAWDVMEDPQFPPLTPDFALALHNLPGYPENTVVFRRSTFASASVGMKVELVGVPSHAAQPEKARTPAVALSRLLRQLPQLSRPDASPERLLTITHASMGRQSFGVTPGKAVLFATLRSSQEADLTQLEEEAQRLVRDTVREEGLSYEIDWVERFPETYCDHGLVSLLHHTCEENSVSFVEVDRPFRWSDDFGHFAKMCPILYFGLGVGENAPHLHQHDYRFSDELLPVGVKLFHSMARRLTS
ncbi:MAG: amidohydrolase [Myxococcota bacterium]